MIKTGVHLSSHTSAELIRLLVNHPDVDLKWVGGIDMPAEGVGAVFDELQGEVDKLPVMEDFTNLDLYIGRDFDGLQTYLDKHEGSKAIVLGAPRRAESYPEAVVGICEYNRKPLVRGARLALQPDVPTLLGAIALMPLAKNLMLNSVIGGTMLLPNKSMKGAGSFRVPSTTLSPLTFKTLREKVLQELQTSFDSPIEVASIESHDSDFACAVLNLDVKIDLNDVRKLYRDFYDDHRHIVFPTHPVNEAMVIGTNKTVIGLGKDGFGRLVVTVAFDARYKGGAGNIVHILNLLFGLEERTGF